VTNLAGSATSSPASLTVNQLSQAITFAAIPNKLTTDAPFMVSAGASSGLPVSFSGISGPATISRTIITLTGAGSVTVRATQLGDAVYLAAAAVDRSFAVLSAGTLQFTSATASVAENAGTVTLSVTRAGGSDGAVAVGYTTANGTATAGSDYTATSGTLSWASGDTASKTITVLILNDTAVESSETFNVTLSTPTGGATLGTPASVTVTITDDDLTAFAVRQLPGGYSPNSKFTVTITATPAANVGVYAVEDAPPVGWTVGIINNSGLFDALNGKVKFGPFFDATARTLTYELTPPANATGIQSLTGTASADGVNSTVGGASTIDRTLRHPADSNPADDRISIGEVTAYGAAWKTGASWPLDPNPIPISYVTRAGALWKGGETYLFDPMVASAPLWWVNGGLAPAGLRPLGAMPTALIPAAVMPGEAMADLAGGFQRNKDFVLTLRVRPSAGVRNYAVEETVPAGWNVKPGSLDQGGAFDGTNRKVKWGPFFDAAERVLTCVLEPGANTAPVVFAGVASFDGVNVGFTGRRAVPRAAFLPENANAGRNVRVDGFRVVVHGEAGKRYDIEATATPWIPNSWASVATNLDGAALVDFTDTLATSSSRRFYRVIER
ncbi:MAG: Calx-beta domain-containing protein, partial [Limisphaerales bacterium]